jgi:uncharacterized repeat protein (TIGR03843 family)
MAILAQATTVTFGPTRRDVENWEPRITEVIGRFTTASNATLLAATELDETVIYKPVAGERPLRDFPPGTLAIREVLTYLTDRTLGFDLVPETTIGDGPYGPGAVQRYVEHDEAFDPLPFVRSADPLLWPMAVLDLVCNNADRKLGHVLRLGERMVAVDHGLTFHAEAKLRTVLWGYAGRPIPADLVDSVERLGEALDGHLGQEFDRRLTAAELDALRRRVEDLIVNPVHPEPPTDRPAIPWPPY